MTLPTPRLDDRSFQDLVDDAKRFIQERCPEWTDHNVSDPGITLVESFAWMTDLLLYRLNRVPDRVYIKFLELLGVQLYPPTAARVDVDFRLAAPAAGNVLIPTSTEVSTVRTLTDLPVSFATIRSGEILAARVEVIGSAGAGGEWSNHTAGLGLGGTFGAFSETPADGDALYLGLDMPVGDHLVIFTVDCERGAGHGIVPASPPIVWEASVGDAWLRCDLIDDSTGGFNVPGTIEVRVPAGHSVTRVGGLDHAWIRARIANRAGVLPYQASPRLRDASGATIGVVIECVNALRALPEILGESTGVAGQEFHLDHGPVIPSDEVFFVISHRPDLRSGLNGGDVVRVDDGDDGQEPGERWDLRPDFSDSSADDSHVTLDPTDGIVRLGPMVRLQDGSVRQYGKIPPKGSVLSVPGYWYGGGADGNVAANAISVLRSSVPSIATVRNRKPARGGVGGETVAEAKIRGPIQVRTRNRAVTAEDFEHLVREAAPEIRRVRCIADTEGDDPAAVRVLIVPGGSGADGVVELADLEPSAETCDRIRSHLDDRRLVGTRIRVEPPQYVGIQIRATIEVEPQADARRVQAAGTVALNRYFDPLIGGPRGGGWPFGRAVRAAEAYGVLQAVPGLDVVTELELLAVDLGSGETEVTTGTVELYPSELVLSVDHQLTVAVP